MSGPHEPTPGNHRLSLERGGDELPRLRELSPGQDLVGVSELVRAAMVAPELSAGVRQQLRARLRRSLGSGRRRRWRGGAVLRPALVVLAALVNFRFGKALLGSSWMTAPLVPFTIRPLADSSPMAVPELL